MGYAPDIYELVWHHEVLDTDDDQLYYTNLYLNQEIRVRTTTPRIYVVCVAVVGHHFHELLLFHYRTSLACAWIIEHIYFKI